MSDQLDELSISILRTLREESSTEGVSLPKIGKRLGVGVSVLLRSLNAMSDASFGGMVGPGWVRVVESDGRWVAFLTPAGAALFNAPDESLDESEDKSQTGDSIAEHQREGQ